MLTEKDIYDFFEEIGLIKGLEKMEKFEEELLKYVLNGK